MAVGRDSGMMGVVVVVVVVMIAMTVVVGLVGDDVGCWCFP